MDKVTAVVLAAGLGTRMKSDLPKVLHPIGSSTVLGKVISNLDKAGIKDIIVVVGHKAELIEKLFEGKARFVRQPELVGSGDALARAVEVMGSAGGTVLVTCGDTPLITDETYRLMVETHKMSKAACVVLTCLMDDPFSYGRIVRGEEGRVAKIVEEKDADEAEKKINEVNVGSYCFRAEDLARFIRRIRINEKKKEFYLTDIVEILRENGLMTLAHLSLAEESIGINSRRDLSMANKAANRKKAEELMDSGVTIIDPDSTYIDADAEVGRDTIIYPATYIEGDVKIGEGCKVGPFARIRPGTRISTRAEIGNFVELCRTIVGEGTKIKHHTYLGDTLVGKNVNIGAGVITANYDGSKKWTTEIDDEAFIGVGVRLIAPVKIGKGAKVGAGSVVTKNKDVKPGETVAGVPAKPLKGKEARP